MSKNGKEKHVGRIHARVFDGQFKAKNFDEGSKEPIKNSIDAEATVIHFKTDVQAELVIRDNGTGATKIKRAALIDLGNSTSQGDTSKSGFFGSGRIHFAYPISSKVTYLTAPQDEQDKVYKITIDMDTYFQRLRDGEEFEWIAMDKTRETWPFDHETGMVITYRLRPEIAAKAKPVKRGKTLATMLSATLPPYWTRKIFIDGQRLPERAIVGKAFSERLPVAQLESVTSNLYRPKEHARNERLRIGGQQIGEVPFSKFVEMLDPEQRDEVPDVFMHPDCCGEILCPKFAPHNVDSRESFAESLLSERWIPIFLSTLQRLAPKVESHLGIQINRDAAAVNEDRVIADRLARRLIDRYGPVDNDEDEVEPDTDDDEKESKEAALALSLVFSHGTATRELEIGETVDITPVIRENLIGEGGKKPEVDWDTDEALGKITKLTGGSIRVTATTVGAGKVVAYLSQQVTAACHFTVVEKREIRLSCDTLRLNENEKYRFRILNADRLAGRKLAWSKGQGPGVLEVGADNLSATYVASNRGTAELEVTVNGKPFDRMRCTITIKSIHDAFRLIRIEDRTFRIMVKGYGHPNIVSLVFPTSADKPGDLIIDAKSPLYTSLKAGTPEAMDTVILTALAHTYTVKRLLQPDKVPTEDIAPLSLDNFLQRNISAPTLGLLQSLLQPAKKGNGKAK